MKSLPLLQRSGKDFDWTELEQTCRCLRRLAGVPIHTLRTTRLATLAKAHPGERWVYGYATDILGAVIERASGLTLDEFLHSRILEPLKMRDTHFYLPKPKSDRLAAVYSAKREEGIERAPAPGGMTGQGAYVDGPRKSFSGGAGLVSTALDYARFLQMMLNGGELEGARILSPKTVELMTVDHLGNRALQAGLGFGLGFSVVKDLGLTGQPGSTGEFGWGGAYHSTFWVDPREQLIVVYFTQLIPAGSVDDHGRLRALVYQAISTAADANMAAGKTPVPSNQTGPRA